MKIAVCLSGQLRTWKDAHKSWELLFDNLKNSQNWNELRSVNQILMLFSF